MKIQWRQHELVFIIITFLISLVTQANRVLMGAASSSGFEEQGVFYDPFWHQLFPFLLTVGTVSLLLVLLNLVIKKWNVSFRSLLVLAFCWLVLSASFALAHYQRFYYLHRVLGESGLEQKARQSGMGDAGICLLLYIVYLYLRETIITWANREHSLRSFRIMVLNHVTIILFIYVGVAFLPYAFGIFHSDGPAIFFVFILFPSLVITLVNAYGIFPMILSHNLSRLHALLRLSILPILFTLAAVVVFGMLTGAFHVKLYCIMLLLFGLVFTPLSWLLFRFQRKRLSALLALEKDLGQKTADLAFLRSQINPHFLFNSLNTLYSLALREAARDTANGIQQLGDMMRFMLHENQRDYIPLKREIEYMRHYISLQEMRIAKVDGIHLETSIDENNCDHFIAPMLLIPFVENAFKHGIRLTTTSYIKIRLYCDPTHVYLDVVNSLHELSGSQAEESGASGIGLDNVKKRLELIYPGRNSLRIHKDDSAFQIQLQISLPNPNHSY